MRAILAAVLTLALFGASSARATDAAPDGAALYAARCAGCHDNASDRTPSRDVLSKNPPTFILTAMRTGAMAPMAQGLAPNEMVAIARYVSKVAGDPDPQAIWGPSAANLPLDGPTCDKPAPPIDLNAGARWNGWSPKPDNARFQPNPGLTAAQVPRLKLKWAFNYPGSKNGQATILGERLYVTSMSGAVYMLNARTGCIYWRHAAEAATRSSVTIVALPKGAGAKHALFFSDWTKSAVALDADTGKQLWKTRVDDSDGLQMTGPPTVHGGRVFVPISSGIEAFAQDDRWECCKFRGSIVALDAATGRILWKTYTTDQEPKVFKTNKLGKPMWGPSGGSVWSAPTVDAKRGLIYVGTSNSYTDVPYDGSDAVIAMDMATGQVRWKKQLLEADNYINGCWRGPNGDRATVANCPAPLGPDFAIGNSPILVDLKGGKQLLVVGQKSSHVHALDPAQQGKIVWQQRLSPGSALGGVEFGMAVVGERVFAGVSDVILGPTGKPGLYALNLADGSVAWSAPSPPPKCRWGPRWCHGAISQAVTAIPGVIFAGAYDGHFRAYRITDGQVIWDVDTGSEPIAVLGGRKAYGGVFDGAGPTVAGGMVYVHSGYAGRSGASAGNDLTGSDGNVLMAFSVDGR
ncbi:MAG: PQQ-binding-like beta-propeller repeat protein [Alphaproteobacteria bacterium]|nr:PQQ-binding-like beta-propeller repeat protein [Alphaproteobacteria bacterium]MBU1516408.1 PQQ-binding-like beta-propeller repeat protein [Alphaproteobacteria bacterium]MBU2093355.1 PQQ-binding-like beta-propeller repeat protein [Alphaproteobacteria bacterium]MBU2153842.1 PQQ-binding-like beta-propeller repeat protein [Alphaproteobacteria bacterium]MBU2307714.1 PQQ-binding-like beta-propeller repeat protein [Alphaproteobacteria bacterium]